MTGETRAIHGERVRGLDLDAETRCRHYHSVLDVIALRFRCCGEWYPCFECHAACADHPAAVWKADERHHHAEPQAFGLPPFSVADRWRLGKASHESRRDVFSRSLS